MTLQPSIQKLTPEELEETYALLRADVPFREVAQRFGISDASLWRLAERDGVALRPKGQKLTPTQRKLTPEEQQEVRDLVKAGVSLRQTAKQFGISRNALERSVLGNKEPLHKAADDSGVSHEPLQGSVRAAQRQILEQICQGASTGKRSCPHG